MKRKETLVQRSCYSAGEKTIRIFEKFPGNEIIIKYGEKEVIPVFHTENLPPGSRLFLKKWNYKFAVEVFGKLIIPFDSFEFKLENNYLHIRVKHCGFFDDNSFVIVDYGIGYDKLIQISPSGKTKYVYIPIEEIISYAREGEKLKIIYNTRNIKYKEAQQRDAVLIEDTEEIILQEDFWKDFHEESRIYEEDEDHQYEILGTWKGKRVVVIVDESPMRCNWSGWGSWDTCPNYCRPGNRLCNNCEWAVLPDPIIVHFLKQEQEVQE